MNCFYCRASGAGKTTLLQILGTLDEQSKLKDSSLLINNVDVTSLSDKSLAKFRNNHIGFIFQFHQLLPEFTALENVCIPAYINKKTQVDAEIKAKELLDFLGLKDRYITNLVNFQEANSNVLQLRGL